MTVTENTDKTKRYKVTVKAGYEREFMDFCKEHNISCKQYNSAVLRNRFGTDANNMVNNFFHLVSVEDMPEVVLS